MPMTPPWVDNPLVLEGPVTRVAGAVVLHARYLAKMVFPYRLTVEYGFDEIQVLPFLPWGALAALAGCREEPAAAPTCGAAEAPSPHGRAACPDRAPKIARAPTEERAASRWRMSKAGRSRERSVCARERT